MDYFLYVPRIHKQGDRVCYGFIYLGFEILYDICLLSNVRYVRISSILRWKRVSWVFRVYWAYLLGLANSWGFDYIQCLYI